MRENLIRWQIYNGDPRTGNPYKDSFVLVSEHPARVLHPLAWNYIRLAPGSFVDLPHLCYQAYFAEGTMDVGHSASHVQFQLNSGRCRGARSLAESARINRDAVRHAEKGKTLGGS